MPKNMPKIMTYQIPGGHAWERKRSGLSLRCGDGGEIKKGREDYARYRLNKQVQPKFILTAKYSEKISLGIK